MNAPEKIYISSKFDPASQWDNEKSPGDIGYTRDDIAMVLVPVADADLPHVEVDLALLLRDGSWIQGDHDHGAFLSAMGRDVTYEVTHIMRVKMPGEAGK